jgi:hypothetical protein
VETLTRWVVRLLAFALVPLLVVTGGSGAQAATTAYSGQQPVTFSYDEKFPGVWMKCSASLVYSVSGNASSGYLETVIGQAGDCDTGPGLNVGGGTITYTAKGGRGNGATCSATATGTIGDGGNENTPRLELGYGFTPVSADNLCTVSEFCWSVHRTAWGPYRDVDASGCKAVAMGNPSLPGAGPSCAVGHPKWTQYWYSQESAADGLKWRYNFRLAFSSASTQSSRTWFFQPFYGTPSSNSAEVGPYISTTSWNLRSSTMWDRSQWGQGAQGRYANNQTGAAPVGVQVFTSEAGYTKGLTQPGRCSFWFGAKVATDDPNSVEDEPYAALSANGATSIPDDTVDPGSEVEPVEPGAPAPPAAEDTGCSGFSFTDPSTWAGAGICVLVKALQAIWDVLSGIAGVLASLAAAIFGPIVDALSALAGAIVDGISALFVPASGYLDGKVGEVQDAWSDSPFGTLGQGFGDVGDWLTVSGSSSCEGAPVTLHTPFGVQTWHLFSSCSGGMASIANISRLGMTVMAYVAAAVAGLRIVGSSFGLNLSLGKGGDDS